ncbi:MAG: AAA family ATPase [Clostridia bacterium]|nr:AAA family ATPase [Clostridia bacterium]
MSGKRFYIKEIDVSGPNVEPSSVTFSDGVNIVYGPSNTGKSYLLKCIDFMFGARDVPFSCLGTGYDTVTIQMFSTDGHSIRMTRKIVEGKNGEKGAGTVSVDSTFDRIESGDYKLEGKGDTYGVILLRLLGIDEQQKIIAKRDYSTNNLTLRSFFHFFYLDETNIIRPDTALVSSSFSEPNACLMTLLYLLTGKNFSEIIPQYTDKQIEERKMQRAGVKGYLNQKLSEIASKKEELEQALSFDDNEIEKKIGSTLREIEEIESEISEALTTSSKNIKRLASISSKLEEAYILKERYVALQSQYSSDIKRLEFVNEGEKNFPKNNLPVKCPYCDAEIKNPSSRISYVFMVEAEAAKTRFQQSDLQEAISDIDQQINSLENKSKILKQANDDIMHRISIQLGPKVAELREQIDKYKRLIEIRREIDSLDKIAKEFNEDNLKIDNEKDEKPKEFKAKDFFDDTMWNMISNHFETMVKACEYPDCVSAEMSKETVDAVVNGKHKKDEGKGYRAFLNTIVLFTIMKVLEEKALHRLGILIVDSPILSLKEKYDFDESDKATPGMKESLFRYILANSGDNQVIIAENELPENVAFSDANLIQFTMDEERGRYGFMHSYDKSKNAE